MQIKASLSALCVATPWKVILLTTRKPGTLHDLTNRMAKPAHSCGPNVEVTDRDRRLGLLSHRTVCNAPGRLGQRGSGLCSVRRLVGAGELR